jgi:deazaflavin-dependent oxidoreductase (nitroreductase family)
VSVSSRGATGSCSPEEVLMTDADHSRRTDCAPASGPAWYALKRRIYRGGRPGAVAKAMNVLTARLYATGALSSGRGVTLETRGRRSGKPVSLPVVVADYAGSHHLVSMLGGEANWVRNVHAADGQATLVRRGRHPVRLVEVPVDQRAPILRRYLEVAPGARPHIPVSRKAPPEQFQQIAAQFPVFRIDDRPEQDQC